VKALTLTQPWATLVAIGAKRIETRSWSTNHRGLIAIHAGKAMPRECRAFAYADPAGQALNDAGILLGGDCAELPRGAVVAIARLVAVVCTDNVIDQPDEFFGGRGLLPHELAFGDYSAGRYAWVLDRVVALSTPVPCKGALGLWTVPADIVHLVRQTEVA
jgi:hypothetical protein